MSAQNKRLDELFAKALKKKDFKNWGATLLNITDKDQYSAEYLCSLNAVESFLAILESEYKESPNSPLLNATLDILFNISKYEPCVSFFETASAVKRIMPLMKAEDVDLKATAAMCLANLVQKEEDFDILRSDRSVIDFLLAQLINADTSYDTSFSDVEILSGLRKISVNDENKILMAANPKVLNKLTEIVSTPIKKKTSEKILHAVGALFNLAFKDENKEILKKVPGLVAALKKIVEANEPDISKNAKGALWLLDEISINPFSSGDNYEFDVMLSYNWVRLFFSVNRFMIFFFFFPIFRRSNQWLSR